MPDTHRSQYRLPLDLYEKLQESAQATGRSLNAEIVARLQLTFAPDLPDLKLIVEEAVRKALAKPH
jgi:predicted DNA-binding protein